MEKIACTSPTCDVWYVDEVSLHLEGEPREWQSGEQRRTWLPCRSPWITPWPSMLRRERGWVPWLKAPPVIRDSPEHPCLPGDLLLSRAEPVRQRRTQQAASHKQVLHQGCLCQAIKRKFSVSVPIHSKGGTSPPFYSSSQQRKPWHSFSTHLSVSVSLSLPSCSPVIQCFPSFWPIAKSIFINAIS